MRKELRAFTLSEVLLVLSVIGVVAALTIPTLIQKVSNDQYNAGLKKAYSTAFQVYTMLLAENGGDISSVFSGNGTISDSVNVMNSFAAKLNVVKNCGSGLGCLYTTEQKYLNGSQSVANFDSSLNGGYAKVVLSNGTMVIMEDFTGVCSTDLGDGPLDGKGCGTYFVDINGSKPPNTRGKDYFVFWVTTTGLYPRGSHNDGYACSTGVSFATSDGCTAKVLQEGAMNY